MRITVLGGGGFRVPLIHRALGATGLPIDEFVLQDVSAERLDVMRAVLRDDRVRTTTDLDTAVDGATLVFSAIRVGGVDGRVRDERSALDAGVLGQETVGAGGLAYAARAASTVQHIATRVAERAPQAWLISMTNPAGIVTELSAAVLGERAIGVCDSPTALIRRACAALGVDAGASLGTIAADVEVDYVGINHLGWLRGLRHDGVDLLPRLLTDAAALERIEEGRLFGADVIAALGALPNEYLYWYYGAREALAGVRAAGRTRGELVRAEQQRFYAAAASDPSRAAELWQAANDERNRTYFAELRADERDETDVAAGGYESIAAALATALVGGEPATLVLDVVNGTAVAGLASDVVVEVPCSVDATGAHPLPVNRPDLHQLGLMSSVRASERAVVAAALANNNPLALQAFLTHPLVGSLAAARELADLALRREGPRPSLVE